MRAFGSRFNLRTNHHVQYTNESKGGATSSDSSRNSGSSNGADSQFSAFKVYFFWGLVIVFGLVCLYFVADFQTTGVQGSEVVSKTAVLASSNATLPSPATSRKGLYATSKQVIEIMSEGEFRETKSRQDVPLMIVYYASWCGHCQRFAPIFTSIADKITSRTESLNSNHAVASRFPQTQFFAVDCMSFRSICDRERINAYPTVAARNFPGAAGETKLVGAERAIMEHFATFLFKHGELDSSFTNGHVQIRSGSGQLAGRAGLDPIARHNASAAFLADNKARYNDLLASFFFFLAREMPKEVPQDQLATLRGIGSLLRHTAPAEQAALRGLLDEVLGVMLKYAKAAFLPRNKVVDIVHKRLPGMAPQPSTKRSLRTSSLTLQWRVCGVDVSSSRASSHSGHTDGARGYTCGLWMLFHHLSVHAAGLTWEGVHLSSRDKSVSPRSSASLLYSTGPVQAADILALVKDFVASFFGCTDCRTHFLRYYHQAWFDRDQIQTFEDLQLWLLRLHNLVNLRVAYEACPSTSVRPGNLTELEAPAKEAAIQTAVDDVVLRAGSAARRALWPSHTECPACQRIAIEDYVQSIRARSDLAHVFADTEGRVDHESVMRDLVVKLIDPVASLHYLQKLY